MSFSCYQKKKIRKYKHKILKSIVTNKNIYIIMLARYDVNDTILPERVLNLSFVSVSQLFLADFDLL
jgi:hypothetical protein